MTDVGADGARDVAVDEGLAGDVGCARDDDGDGFVARSCGGSDCDDGDARRFPGNAEVCDADGHDEDCEPCTVASPTGLDGDRDGDTYVSERCTNAAGGAALTCSLRVRVVGGRVQGTDCNDDPAMHGADTHPNQTEVCDGRDNNCDGVSDEGDPQGGGACGTALAGACMAGVNHCVGGALACVASVTPGVRTETCNGVDDDCDGAVDDSPTGVGAACDGDFRFPSDPPQGRCRRGVTSCQGARGLVCEGAVGPVAERCDGADDDCDGSPDNGFPCVAGAALSCTTTCGSAGRGACSARCELPTPEGCTPPAERCNGADDDCVGGVDNGLPTGGTLQPIGAFADNISRSAVASDGDRFAIAYCAGNALRFSLVGDDGRAVGTPTTVSTGIHCADYPRVVARAGGWAVAWNDFQVGNSEVFVALLDEAGSVTGHVIQVSHAPRYSTGQTIAAIGGDVAVAWSDQRDYVETGRSSVYFSRVSSSGDVMVPEARIAMGPESATPASLVVAGAELALVWRRSLGAPTYRTVDVFRRMTPMGTTIAEVDLPLPSTAGRSEALAWDGSSYAVAFTDRRDGWLDPYLMWLTPTGAADGVAIRLSSETTQVGRIALAARATSVIATWQHVESVGSEGAFRSRLEGRRVQGRVAAGPVYALAPDTYLFYDTDVAISSRRALFAAYGSMTAGSSATCWARTTGLNLCD